MKRTAKRVLSNVGQKRSTEGCSELKCSNTRQFNSFEDIFKWIEDIFNSFEDIFNSFEDIYNSFEDILK